MLECGACAAKGLVTRSDRDGRNVVVAPNQPLGCAGHDPIRSPTLSSYLRANGRPCVSKNDKYAYRVGAAVLFGSTLRETERVGDVDVAVSLVPRWADRDEFAKALEHAMARAPRHLRQSLLGQLMWPQREVERAIVGRSRGRIALRPLDEIEPLLKVESGTPKYEVLFGTWIPPMRAPKQYVEPGADALLLMKHLEGGHVLQRHGDRDRPWYAVGSYRARKVVVDQLFGYGPFTARDPDESDSFATEWVLSAKAYAALERGSFEQEEHSPTGERN